MVEKVSGGRSLAGRLYYPRIVGLGLGFFCVASVFQQNGASTPIWLALIANGFLWPHAAYFLAKSSGNPYLAERRNILADSFLGGFWVPLMSFNALPTITIIFMLSMNNIAVGGLRLYVKGLAAQLAGVLAAAVLFGLHVRVESNMPTVLACLPMLSLYPLYIGYVTYRMARKLNRQRTDVEEINVRVLESQDRLIEVYEKLWESEERYRLISENAGDVIWLWDLNAHRYSYLSPSLEKLCGFTVDEVMGQSLADVLPQESQWLLTEELPRRVRAMEAGDETARVKTYELHILHKNGTLVPTEVMTTLITDAGGRATHIQGISRDITRRMQVEAQLRERNAQLDLALGAAHMGTWYLDLTEGKRYYDQRVFDLLGIDPATFRGTVEEFLRILHPDDRGKVRESMVRTIERNEPYELEYRIAGPDGGYRFLSARGRLVRDEAGKPMRIDGVLMDVTEKKRTEAALLESESLFRDLSEKSVVGIYLIQDHVFRYVNSELARIMGYSIDEITDKMGPRDVIFPEDREEVEGLLQKRFSGELKSVSFGFRVYTGSKDVRHVEVYSSRTSYRGRPAVIGTLLDVSDRKWMEEALRASEERYRSIFENATEGIFQSTPDGRFLRVNPAMARIWGYNSPEEMVEKVTDLGKRHYVDPQGRELFKSVIAERGSVQGFKVEVYRKDRRRIWVSLNARAVRDPEGRLLYYEGTNEDITEQKLMEDMIAENERRYRHLVENSNDIIYTTDLRGTVTYVNPVTERVTGYTVSHLFGKKVFNIVREDYREPMKAFYERHLSERRQPSYFEFPVITGNGEERWFGQQVQIIYDKDKAAGFQATARDITDRLKAEEEHRQREKLGAVIEMAGGVCHEMNQPLQIIYGLADLLRIRTAKEHPLYGQITDIKKAADRISTITRKLMGITRYETKPYAGQSKIVDIDKSSPTP